MRHPCNEFTGAGRSPRKVMESLECFHWWGSSLTDLSIAVIPYSYNYIMKIPERWYNCYVSAFSHLRHFMFLGYSSVNPPQVWNTLTGFCLPVSPERFLGIFQKTHKRNGLSLAMLMYPDQVQNLLDYGHDWLIFLILMQFGWRHGRNGLQFCMLIYSDHRQNW